MKLVVKLCSLWRLAKPSSFGGGLDKASLFGMFQTRHCIILITMTTSNGIFDKTSLLLCNLDFSHVRNQYHVRRWIENKCGMQKVQGRPYGKGSNRHASTSIGL
jgi:hypothetical protein